MEERKLSLKQIKIERTKTTLVKNTSAYNKWKFEIDSENIKKECDSFKDFITSSQNDAEAEEPKLKDKWKNPGSLYKENELCGVTYRVVMSYIRKEILAKKIDEITKKLVAVTKTYDEKDLKVLKDELRQFAKKTKEHILEQIENKPNQKKTLTIQEKRKSRGFKINVLKNTLNPLRDF